MEEDRLEMTKEELHMLIREITRELSSPDVTKKCHLLQSLLKRKEKRAAQFLKLCKSVEECEELVRKLFSLLGWEYSDTDSDEERNDSDSGNMSQFLCESASSETGAVSSTTTNVCNPQLPQCQDSKPPNTDEGTKTERKDSSSSVSLMKNAVVVLTRLPEDKIPAVHPPASQQYCSEDELLSSCDSDSQWEPSDSSSGFDYKRSRSKPGPVKKRRIDHKTGKHNKNDSKKKSEAKKTNDATDTNGAKKTPTVQTNSNTKGQDTVNAVSTTCQVSKEVAWVRPKMPVLPVTVNMMVVARRKPMQWQPGKIMATVTKGDGKLKYKVSFTEKGKSLVSGHHIAFGNVPNVEHLHVGTRVVVTCEDNKSCYRPGVLAEIPNRKNRSRFLVYMDDHTPVYVGMHSLRIVCRPLEEPLDDISDSVHKNFMKEYMNVWPQPPMTHYMVGQVINVEFDGVQKACKVEVVDCSLIQVVFQDDEHKEWIYRGSIRLEHMLKMKEHMRAKQTEKQTTS